MRNLCPAIPPRRTGANRCLNAAQASAPSTTTVIVQDRAPKRNNELSSKTMGQGRCPAQRVSEKTSAYDKQKQDYEALLTGMTTFRCHGRCGDPPAAEVVVARPPRPSCMIAWSISTSCVIPIANLPACPLKIARLFGRSFPSHDL